MTSQPSVPPPHPGGPGRLRGPEEMYGLLIDAAEDYAIYLVDPAGRIASWNRGAELLSGYSTDEVVGEHFSLFYSPEDRDSGYPDYEIRIAAETGRFEDEGWRIRKDGSRFWANAVITAIRESSGSLLGFGMLVRDLTVRRRIERLLEGSEQRYRSLFEHNPDPVFSLDLEGRFVRANGPTLHVSGYAEDELIGTPLLRLVAPDYLEETRAAFFRASQGEPSVVETVILTREGGRRELSVSAVPTLVDGEVEGVFGIAEDVTERRRGERERLLFLEREKAAREAAEAAEDRSRFLAEASKLLARSLDYQDTLRQVARLAVPRLADYCLVDVLEEDGTISRMEVCHVDPDKEELLREMQRKYPLDGTRPHPVLDVLRTGEPVLVPEVAEQQVDEVAHDGDHRESLRALRVGSYMCVPLRARGRTLGVISFVCTGSGRHYTSASLDTAEELARRAAVAVDNARLYRAALAASQAKSQFLATMSHELRTPLNAIIGYTSLLEAGVTGPINEAQRQQLTRVDRSSRHLLQLIDEILSFARMEAGREEVEVERVALGDLVEDVCSIIEPLATAKGLAFRVDTHRPEETLDTDPRKLRQILLNLLSNAVKFTEEGEVSLEARVVDHTVELRVSDTGIGIAADQSERIYQPFVQVDQAASRRIGGTGLGLAVTRHLVHLLGGEITLASAPGEGATFTVILPARVARPT